MASTTPSPKLIIIFTLATVLSIFASGCQARNILLRGEALYAGQSLDAGSYSLKLEDDCNLVLYEYKTLVWASKSAATGRNGCRAVLQSDANFVIYDSNGRAVWNSNTARRNDNYILVLQEDRNVVIYGPDIWSTHTYRKSMDGVVVTATNGTVDGGLGCQNATAIVGGIGHQNATAVEEAAAAAAV